MNEKRRNWDSFYLLFSFWLRHRLCFHIFSERAKSFQNSSERVKNLFSFVQKSTQISFISCTLSHCLFLSHFLIILGRDQFKMCTSNYFMLKLSSCAGSIITAFGELLVFSVFVSDSLQSLVTGPLPRSQALCGLCLGPSHHLEWLQECGKPFC